MRNLPFFVLALTCLSVPHAFAGCKVDWAALHARLSAGSAGEDLATQLAQVMPVTVEARIEFMREAFGDDVVGHVYSGNSNKAFVDDLMKVAGKRIQERDTDGSFRVLKVARAYHEKPTAFDSPRSEPLPPSEVERQQYQRISDLLDTPAANQTPLAVSRKAIDELIEGLAPLMPASAEGRYKLAYDTFGPEVATQLDFDQAPAAYAYVLLKYLQDPSRHSLTQKNADGKYVLLVGLEKFRSLYPEPAAQPKHRNLDLKLALARLCDSPELGQTPVWPGDPKVKYAAMILEHFFPSDPEQRRLWVKAVFKPGVVNGINYIGNNQTFAYHLLYRLSVFGQLHWLDKHAEYPLPNVIFE